MHKNNSKKCIRRVVKIKKRNTNLPAMYSSTGKPDGDLEP
jgi:hypothetical protein